MPGVEYNYILKQVLDILEQVQDQKKVNLLKFPHHSYPTADSKFSSGIQNNTSTALFQKVHQSIGEVSPNNRENEAVHIFREKNILLHTE